MLVGAASPASLGVACVLDSRAAPNRRGAERSREGAATPWQVRTEAIKLSGEGGGRRMRHKNLDRPDGTREFPHGRGSFVDLGTITIGRAILEPGWRWSEDVKPMVGTPWCRLHHLHLLLAGRFGFQMEDGERREFEPNDVMDIPPGHDAWVIGDQPVVLIDIAGNISDFGLPVPRTRALVTMLMTDIVSSTETAARLGDAGWRQRLAEHNRFVRRQLDRFGGREIDTTGDGFLAIFDSPAAALLAGVAIRDGIAAIDLSVRIGVHTGEIELMNDDVGGIAVHATARVMAAAQPSEVLTTPVTRALAEGAPFRFEDRGESQLKGIAQPIHLYAVVPAG